MNERPREAPCDLCQGTGYLLLAKPAALVSCDRCDAIDTRGYTGMRFEIARLLFVDDLLTGSNTPEGRRALRIVAQIARQT